MSPLPQDVPPPRDSSPSQDKKASSTAKFKVKHAAKNCQLSVPLQELLSTSELEATMHDVFTEDGRERVLFVQLPLDDLVPSKSPTLISLATLWVNLLLRKTVRMKHWSWAYVLHILNNEAANVTFDELFRESTHCSQGDICTQVFVSILQNEASQDKLSNFLKEFVQKCVAKGSASELHKLEIIVSYGVMENSELKIEFQSFVKGFCERVQMCTTPDSSGEPPHLTAYLTVLLDDTDVSERLSGCSLNLGVNCSESRSSCTEAADKNKVMFTQIQNVAEWQHIEKDQNTSGVEAMINSESSDVLIQLSQTSSSSPTIPYALSKFDKSALDQDVHVMNVAKKTEVQFWLPQSDVEFLRDGRVHYMPSDNNSNNQGKVPRRTSTTCSLSSGIESGDQRMTNKEKSIFNPQKSSAIFRHTFRNFLDSDLEQRCCHEFSNPMHSFPAVAEINETLFDILLSSVNEPLPPGKTLNTRLSHTGSSAPLSTKLQTEGGIASLTPGSTKLGENSSCESSSDDGMTSLGADESSDGGSEEISKKKRLTKRFHSSVEVTSTPVRKFCHITTKPKKSSLVVVYQRSGYSGDDSDCKNECTRIKFTKFTSIQRAARLKRINNKNSSSEYSEAESEDSSAQVWNTEDKSDKEPTLWGIKLKFQFASCAIQISNLSDCSSLISSSTFDSRTSPELHYAVKQQCLQSVRDILMCDGGEDQIQTMDEEGDAPLEIASRNKDLKIFELLLESLICSQVLPSVTLPPCSGHKLTALLASIVKVFSKKEIDFNYSTLHWTMVNCQHWKIPRVVYARLSTVLNPLLEIDLDCSDTNQLLIDKLLEFMCTGGKKKGLMPIVRARRAVVSSVAVSQKLAMQNQQGITADPTSSEATTDRMAEDSCLYSQPKSSPMHSTHKQGETQELVPVQEQGGSFQSEMVSVTRMSDLILVRTYTNSLVTGLTLIHSKGLKFHQIIAISPHQSTQPPTITDTMKNSTDPTPSLVVATTDKKTLPRVAADSPSHSQPKSSAAKLSTHRQVSQFPAASLRSPGAESGKEVTSWQPWIDKAVDCLHAGYYSQMLEVLKFGKVPPPLPVGIAMAAQFGCALAYYKLEKYSEAAKHLESLKAIAASARSCGNESLASFCLGDIEFTQSRYTEAAKHYSHALKLYNSDNLGKEYQLIVPTFSAISARLGTAFRNTSKVVDAVQAYRQAIATADSKKDKLSAHTSLGNLFQSVGENASALAEYEHSIKLSEELRDYVPLGWAHGNMGNAYLGLYQRDKGLYHLEKALDLTVEHEPTPQAIGRAYNNLGTAFQALNELDKAEEKYDLALSQAIYGNDLPGQARVYGNIGNVLMLRKDYDRAVPHYTEVLRLSRDRSTVSTAFHNRGCSYYKWAENKKATLPQKARFTLHGSDFENCEVEHQPSFKSLPNSILKYYQLGRQDLEQGIKYHEETFENIKGSSKGLTLSVFLFETNSRTFHRLQDCLVNLGEWEKALVVAEQSRTRTLGELLVKRKNSKIDHPPLNLQSITDIVQSQHSVVVYLSYTGARLLGWVLAPTRDKVSMDMFEVPLEDDQFDGKSFDYHLRYSLTEELVERSFEMYRAVDYKSDVSEPVRKLYKLVCKPLMKILKKLKDPDSASGVEEMIIIPDSYTCLLPFPCLLDDEDKFLGDSYSFRIMPSLLTMGIIDQLPSVVVQVPADGRSMCVVGNPTIPSFVYNGDQWSLGKLPFATREAEWVANILKTAPILHEQATKDAVLMRIMNAKVIHIATHGSASAGFLAFAGMSSARNGETVEAKNVLLYPEDIERLTISPALVVLSSCDSGRGTVKADGILGMAQAFILAGAQAVLTTLWRVPDESASVFMQFFYQYLMDGLKASLALQKATLSVRCFSKYSQYIHWSGYQLTGREIQFDITKPSTAAALEARLGKSSVFPRLKVVQQLESAFLKDPHTPSDVQILRGSPGVKPSEPLVDFIHSFHDEFKGGIFWINGRRQEMVDTSVTYIKQATGTVPTASQTHPVLVVFDHIDQMPQFSDPSTYLMDLLKHPNTHIVVISKNYAPLDALLREIDHQLLRGCNIIDVKPLSPIHTTQRIVHSILSAHHLPPTNEDQNIFEKLAQFTSGSPALIDVTAALFLSQMEHDSQNELQDTHDTLINFINQLALDEMDPSTKPVTIVRRESPKGTAKTREISKDVYDNIVFIRDSEQDPWCTSSPYDSWQAVTTLIDQCSLSAEEKLLLFAVSMFSCSPVPMSVVTEVSSMIANATQKPHISTSLHSKLFQMQLMKRYPLPVILHPSLGVQQPSTEPEFVYVPQNIARAIWKDMMSDGDKVMALTTMYIALCTLVDNLGSTDIGFLGGLTSLLVELYELNYELMGNQCYREVYNFYLCFGMKLTKVNTEKPVTVNTTQTQFTTTQIKPDLPNPTQSNNPAPGPINSNQTRQDPDHPQKNQLTPIPEQPTADQPTPSPNQPKADQSRLGPEQPKADQSRLGPEQPKADQSRLGPEQPKADQSRLGPEQPKADQSRLTTQLQPQPTQNRSTQTLRTQAPPTFALGHLGECKPISPLPGLCLSIPISGSIRQQKKPNRIRRVVLIGKSQAGKSTIANQLVRLDPLSPIKLPFEDASGPVTATHEVKQEIVEFQWENNSYRLIVIDTVGFLPTKEAIDYAFDKIEKYIITNIERINLFIFVIKKGCFTAEDQEMFTSVFSLIGKRLCNEYSLISALAITGCEDDSPATRERIIRKFKCYLNTQDIANKMGMGIYTVGFPDIKVPVLKQDFQPGMLQDRDTLRGLIIKAKPEKDVKPGLGPTAICHKPTPDLGQAGGEGGDGGSADEQPTMIELLRFRGRKRRINIPQEVSTKYRQFGILLLEDTNGARVCNVEHKHRGDVEQINTEILQEWVRGRGKQPVSWATLTSTLRDVELSNLANEIETVKSQTAKESNAYHP